MKHLTLAALLFFTTILVGNSAMAQDRAQLKDRIRRIARTVEDETYTTTASTQALKEAQQFVQRALQLLMRSGQPTDPIVYQQCVQFAQSKYRFQHSSSDALVMAQKNCLQVVDYAVLQFLYNKHYRDHDQSQSMDLATGESRYEIKGRLQMIEWAFKKHYRDHSNSASATKAVRNIMQLNGRSGISCFEKYFKIHYRSVGSSEAMDRTTKSCSIE